MRTILLLACLVVSHFAAQSSSVLTEGTDSRLESLSWLVGQWDRTDLPDGQSGYERWQLDGLRLTGVGVMLKGTNVVFEEKLRIEVDGSDVLYIADVPGNPAPVRFRMTEQTANAVVFENPNHDFPKRIAYRLVGNHLEAQISADGREMMFTFERSMPSAHASGETANTMPHLITWFEIPAIDLNRAVRFYATVLDAPIEPIVDMGDSRMGMLPSDGRNVSGAIVQGQDYAPGAQGTLIYLSGGKDLSPMLARVIDAGGQVIMPKTQISPEHGFFALFTDTEGNRIGLHSPN